MRHWLMKSEPSAYSWEDMVRDKRTSWTGVRNFQAANNLKAMAIGDRAFFYHSNEGKAIMGVVEVIRAAYPDATDKTGRFVTVDVKPVHPAKNPVTLAAIKSNPALKSLALLRQSRLSVSPVEEDSWAVLAAMAGLKP